MAALNNGTVDAMYAWPPFTTEVQSRGGVVLANPKDAPGGGWSWDGFAANQQWVKDNTATLARFLKALEEGRRTMAQNREAIIQTAVKVTGMPLSTAQATFDLVSFPPLADNLTPGTPISMCSPDGTHGLSATLSQARDFYKSSGQIVNAAEFSDFLNTSALSVALNIRCP
jgi:ABC-type nitrate/sulfonate/bicarbonate transport system substrate-binding protein